jgi:hypothetical protein
MAFGSNCILCEKAKAQHHSRLTDQFQDAPGLRHFQSVSIPFMQDPDLARTVANDFARQAFVQPVWLTCWIAKDNDKAAMPRRKAPQIIQSHFKAEYSNNMKSCQSSLTYQNVSLKLQMGGEG